jgi:hypothetical protein
MDFRNLRDAVIKELSALVDEGRDQLQLETGTAVFTGEINTKPKTMLSTERVDVTFSAKGLTQAAVRVASPLAGRALPPGRYRVVVLVTKDGDA